MKQRTDEWFNTRAGKLTASKAKDILPGKSGKHLKCREDYLFEVVAGRLTGEAVSQSHGKAGAWGTDVEEFAQTMYEVKSGNVAIDCGFIEHSSINYIGVSPDGLIGNDGGVEIKCPANSSVHLKTVLKKEMPEEHIPQVQCCMWVTGRKWWDFVSFDPRMPESLQVYIQRIERDEMFIAELEKEAVLFLEEVRVFLVGITEVSEPVIQSVPEEDIASLDEALALLARATDQDGINVAIDYANGLDDEGAAIFANKLSSKTIEGG